MSRKWPQMIISSGEEDEEDEGEGNDRYSYFTRGMINDNNILTLLLILLFSALLLM